MPNKQWSSATRQAMPLILVRGFGGLGVEEVKKVAYQGFNDGTVYPHRRGENYIYEGLILRFMKSNWRYQDATNVVGYYTNEVEAFSEQQKRELSNHPLLQGFDENFFFGDKIVIDPAMAVQLLNSSDSFQDLCRTLSIPLL